MKNFSRNFVLGITLLLTSSTFASPSDGACDKALLSGDVGIKRVNIPKIADPRDNYHLDVTLGKISATEFETYRTAFRAKNVIFDPNKTYVIQDFFPPFAQALLKKFVPVSSNAPLPPDALLKELKDFAVENELDLDASAVYSSANCHSLTWQWMLYWQNPDGKDRTKAFIFNAERGTIPMLTNPYDEPDVHPSLVEVARAEIKVGDILLIQGANGIKDQDPDIDQHSAVYIGHGLLLEKGDTSETHPYRIVQLEDTLSLYRERLTDSRLRFFRITDVPVRDVYSAFSGIALYPEEDLFRKIPNYMLRSQVVAANDEYFLEYLIEANLEFNPLTGRYQLPESTIREHGITELK